MSLVNYLVEHYGVGIVIDAVKVQYPPGLVLLDGLTEGPLPVVISKWLEAHKQFVASRPASTVDWDKYVHRFLTESPAIGVLLDLTKDLGIAEVAGVDVDAFIEELANEGH